MRQQNTSIHLRFFALSWPPNRHPICVRLSFFLTMSCCPHMWGERVSGRVLEGREEWGQGESKSATKQHAHAQIHTQNMCNIRFVTSQAHTHLHTTTWPARAKLSTQIFREMYPTPSLACVCTYYMECTPPSFTETNPLPTP